MEIEVGDYIRTNHGIIAKLIDINYDEIDKSLRWYWYWHGNMKECINKPYITKYSKNIIDLIEAGDIVRCRINTMREETAQVRPYTDARSRRKSLVVNGFDINEIEILEILTKEQYEQNCFRT